MDQPPADTKTSDAASIDRLLMQQVKAGICVANKDGYLFANAHLAHMLGYTVQEMLDGLQARATIHPQDVPKVMEQVQRRLNGVPGEPYDVRSVRKDGTVIDTRVFGQHIIFNGQSADLVTLTDITELKQALRTADWRARMLQQTESMCRSGSVEIDLRTGRATLSSGMCELLGIQAMSQPIPRRELRRWMSSDELRYVESIWRGAVPGEPFEFQHRIVCADGSRRIVLHRGMLEAAGETHNARGVAILQDITAQRDAERRIQELANYDELTGLPNRALLVDRIDESLHAARRECRSLALICFQVPQVQQVRVSIGDPAAAALAMAVAARLQALFSDEDTLAHLGNGEFALLPDARQGYDESSILQAARAVQAALAEPETLGGAEIYAVADIGVAVYPGDGESPQAILQAAQTAMRAASQEAGERICFFTPQANARAARKLAMESGLRHAVARAELRLCFQPQVDLHSGEMVGVEALLRWQSGALGEVAPEDFLPLAEQTGLIVPIGEWALRTACLQSVAWQRAGLGTLRVAVNLSARQLAQADLAQRIQAIVLETGADPSRLGLEVTESMLAADISHAARTLAQLRALGVRISLDDFGTGYSNLSYLRTLPIDLIKIDRSFVHDVTADTAEVSVTRAVITMAHSLQMKVLAEGVETEGQLALLTANACDQIQGHFFSEPVTPQQIEAMLREGRRLPERFIHRRERRRTLLIVDDEENIVAALKRLLRREGYHIVTANSAAEGLQRLAEVDVDVVLSDQRMPGMTGVEFLRRAKELYPDTVRMVLSGYTELQSITDAVNEGAIYKFLTKPWDDQRLRAHVEEAFRQKEMGDENRRLSRQVQAANQELAELNDRLQQLLATQREQTSLEEGRAANAREVLESVPASIIGLDPDGLIAFVNRDAEASIPGGVALLGREAEEALPMELRDIWRRGDGASHRVGIAGRQFRVICRPMDGGKRARGSLLVLTPDEAQAQVLV